MAIPEYPVTDKEKYLAKMAGQDVTLPDYPVTRTEQYLDAIAKNGGGGGGGGAVVVHLSTEDEETFTADKTPLDVWDAMLDGKVVTGVCNIGENVYPLGVCGLINGNAKYIGFCMDGEPLIEGSVVDGVWQFYE